MTAEVKQLEGLGRLLKAAGVKPAGAEQMIREHLDNMQDDARQQHADVVDTVRTLKEELIELRHNHSFTLSEIRMATDLMRREVEASSLAVTQTLRRAKAGLALLVVTQIVIVLILLAASVRDLIHLPEFAFAPATPKTKLEAGAKPSAPDTSPIQIQR